MFRLPTGAIDDLFTAPKPAVEPMVHLTHWVLGLLILYLVLRLKMGGTIPLLSRILSWRTQELLRLSETRFSQTAALLVLSCGP